MAWFRSHDVRPEPEGPPPWAAFFTTGEHREFLRLITRTLDRQHVLYELGDGQVKVYDPVETILGLANLAQRCHGSPRASWPALVEHHLRVTLEAMTQHVPLSRDGAEASLRLRLMDVDVAAAYELVARPAMHGTVAALFVDRPDAVESVNESMVAAWGIPVDRLFALAEYNTRRHELCDRTTVHTDGLRIHMLCGSSLFTASHALWPEAWLADLLDSSPGPSGMPAGDLGVLLACPTRHVVFAHVVVGRSVTRAIPALADLTRQHYATGPGSLFSSVWWWRSGVSYPVHVDAEGRAVVRAEEQLSEWLNQLAAGEM